MLVETSPRERSVCGDNREEALALITLLEQDLPILRVRSAPASLGRDQVLGTVVVYHHHLFHRNGSIHRSPSSRRVLGTVYSTQRYSLPKKQPPKELSTLSPEFPSTFRTHFDLCRLWRFL